MVERSLTAGPLTLNPPEARKPYYAHQKRMLEFFEELLSDKE